MAGNRSSPAARAVEESIHDDNADILTLFIDCCIAVLVTAVAIGNAMASSGAVKRMVAAIVQKEFQRNASTGIVSEDRIILFHVPPACEYKGPQNDNLLLNDASQRVLAKNKTVSTRKVMDWMDRRCVLRSQNRHADFNFK